MKKFFYTFVILVITLTSCENNQIQVQTEPTITLTAEQQKMRNALESTTNILLDMISSNQAYLDELNKVIVAGSSEYLEDRVMLKDLFESTATSSMLRVKANSERFTSDFKNSFAKSKPQKVSGNTDIDSNIFYNSDSLIQYLIDNNVSLYCPFPIEEYEENNRIPAISFHPMNNDTVNTGYLLNADMSITEVRVCQSYNNLHPVWILMPNESTNSEKYSLSSSKVIPSAPSDGFELTINSIYCTKFYGWNLGIFSADMDIRILRSSSAYSWNENTKDYVGTFQMMKTFKMPRKYVAYAQKGSPQGWFNANIIWDYSWTQDRPEQALSIYEYDDSGDKLTIASTAKFIKKDVGEIGVTVTGEISNKSDIITLEPIGRDYIYNVAINGHRGSDGQIDWVWKEQTFPFVWKTRTHYNGKYIYNISPDFMMTISVN